MLQPPLFIELDDPAELVLVVLVAPAEFVPGVDGVVVVGVGAGVVVVGTGAGVVVVGTGMGVVVVGTGVGVVVVGTGVGVVMVGTGVGVVMVGTGVGGAPAVAPSSPDSEPQPKNAIPVAKPSAAATNTIFFICRTSLFESSNSSHG